MAIKVVEIGHLITYGGDASAGSKFMPLAQRLKLKRQY
jgi:hypothetical protein